MSLLLSAQPIIDRLAATCRPQIREIGAAAELATALKASVASPGAYVVPGAAEPYETREGSGPLRQTFRHTFTVIVRVSLAGARGEAGLKALEEPAGLVRAALFGWQHPAAELRCASAGEGLEDFDGASGVMLYRLDFQTQTRLLENLS